MLNQTGQEHFAFHHRLGKDKLNLISGLFNVKFIALTLSLLLSTASVIAAEPTDKLKLAMLQPENQSETDSPWKNLNPKKLKLRSKSALIIDHAGRVIYGKASGTPMPIASITKLMTAMVILDSKLPLDEPIKIIKQDRDLLRLTGSRLRVGATLKRGELLQLALMASENRAATALARTFPGGTKAFVEAMNKRAGELSMDNSQFADASGLDAKNIASARDLAKMVRAASEYPFITKATTTKRQDVYPYRRKGPLKYGNTNRLLKNRNWNISLSKTGYINEAGRCLVMQAEAHGGPMVIVLLNSFGKLTPFGDSNRIRKWMKTGLAKSS